MNISFTFDGDVLRVLLRVEDQTEQAMAKLMESRSIATVAIQYEEYGYQRTENIKAISIHLRKPAEAQ